MVAAAVFNTYPHVLQCSFFGRSLCLSVCLFVLPSVCRSAEKICGTLHYAARKQNVISCDSYHFFNFAPDIQFWNCKLARSKAKTPPQKQEEEEKRRKQKMKSADLQQYTWQHKKVLDKIINPKNQNKNERLRCRVRLFISLESYD